MSYPIDHHRDGHYIFMDMILTPETVAELDRTLKVTEDVLRHMVIRRDPKAAQKEREEIEARAAAQEQAAGAPPEAETPQESEDSLPVELSPEEIEYVPPAIEEEAEAEEESVEA